MGIILSGANPGVRLYDGDTVTAFASVWTVDWSVHGAGTALVLWHDNRVRVLGADPDLAGWLESYFVRHFPEADGLTWPAPTPEVTEVVVDLDHGGRLIARAADVEIRLCGVLCRRAFVTDDFPLDGVPHGLQLLLAPVSEATISVGGQRLPGELQFSGTMERPSSSAFLATAEVWSR
jgi:hypothetical protein